MAFPAGAAFAKPEVQEELEARGVECASRIPANDSLQWDIAELPPRAVSRPSQKPLVEYKGFLYQQSGEHVAGAGAAEEDRQPVADEPAAAVGADPRPAGETRAVLLVLAG